MKTGLELVLFNLQYDVLLRPTQLCDVFVNGYWNGGVLILPEDDIRFVLYFSFQFEEAPDGIIWELSIISMFSLTTAFGLVRR